MEDYIDEFSMPEYHSRVFHHMLHWEKLSELGDPIYLPGNHYIVSPGEEIRYCYLIREGRVMTMEISSEGEVHIFNIFEEGSLLLESNLLASYKSAIFCQTMMPSVLVRITADQLIRGMSKDQDIMKAVFDSFASKYYSAMDQLREGYNHSSTWKVFNMLMLLSNNNSKPFQKDWVIIQVKITQQLISSMLGINRITVNRALKELKESGMLMIINSQYCIRKPAETDEKSPDGKTR